MAKQIIVTQNDYGIELETQFVDDKKKPLDITDYDVRVKIIYDDKTIDTVLAEHKDSINGIAYIVLEKEHLINAGLHTSVWSVVDEDEHVTAQENVYYFVKDVEGSEDDTPTTDLPIDADGVLNKFNEIDNNLFELTEQGNVVNEEIDSINETLSVVNEQLDTIANDVNNITTSNLSLKRYGRKFFKAESGIYHNSQAMCYLGNNVIVQAYQLYHGNTLKLERMDLITGNVLATNIIDGFHGNGMCYNDKDGYIYITPAHNYEQSLFFKTVLKVDVNTLSVVSTIDLTTKTSLSYIHSIGYDEINDNFIVNNKNTFEVYSNAWEYIKTFTIDYNYIENRYQTITVKNGKIYQVLSAPESIAIYDISKAQITSIINVDKWHEKIFNLGEIEGIDIINNKEDVIITSICNLSNKVGGSLVQFWKGNLKTNSIDSNIQMNFQNAQEVTNVHVNSSIVSYNPRGTKSIPFNTLTEASISLCSPYIGTRSLNLDSSFDETLTLVEQCSNLVVNTNGNKVKALVCIYARNVYFHELKLTGYSTYNNNAIYLYMSDVVINGFTGENINDSITNYAHIERSTATLPIALVDRSDIKVLLKNSKCTINQYLTTRKCYKALVKENSNSRVNNLKWCNGQLLTEATRPSDWEYYTKARVMYKFNDLSDFSKEVNFGGVNATIRIDGIHQKDTGEIRVFTAYLKPETNGSNKYVKGGATGFTYINGTMTLIPNEDIDVKFDIAFYD